MEDVCISHLHDVSADELRLGLFCKSTRNISQFTRDLSWATDRYDYRSLRTSTSTAQLPTTECKIECCKACNDQFRDYKIVTLWWIIRQHSMQNSRLGDAVRTDTAERTCWAWWSRPGAYNELVLLNENCWIIFHCELLYTCLSCLPVRCPSEGIIISTKRNVCMRPSA